MKLNDTYFNTSTYNTEAWRNLVSCQEVGHTFGLDHQDENFNNPNLGTCMDYTNDPSSNQHPNQHDYDHLMKYLQPLLSAVTWIVRPPSGQSRPRRAALRTATMSQVTPRQTGAGRCGAIRAGARMFTSWTRGMATRRSPTSSGFSTGKPAPAAVAPEGHRNTQNNGPAFRPAHYFGRWFATACARPVPFDISVLVLLPTTRPDLGPVSVVGASHRECDGHERVRARSTRLSIV